MRNVLFSVDYKYYDGNEWSEYIDIDNDQIIGYNIGDESLVDDNIFMQESRTSELTLFYSDKTESLLNVLLSTAPFRKIINLHNIPEWLEKERLEDTDVLKVYVRMFMNGVSVYQGYVDRTSVSVSRKEWSINFSLVDRLYLYKLVLEDARVNVGRWDGDDKLIRTNDLFNLLRSPIKSKGHKIGMTDPNNDDNIRFVLYESDEIDGVETAVVDMSEFEGHIDFDSLIGNNPDPVSNVIDGMTIWQTSYDTTNFLGSEVVAPFSGQSNLMFAIRPNFIKGEIADEYDTTSANVSLEIVEAVNTYGMILEGVHSGDFLYERKIHINFWIGTSDIARFLTFSWRKRISFDNNVSIKNTTYESKFFFASGYAQDFPDTNLPPLGDEYIVEYISASGLSYNGRYNIVTETSNETENVSIRFSGALILDRLDFGNNAVLPALDVLRAILFLTNSRLMQGRDGYLRFKGRDTTMSSPQLDITNDDFVIDMEKKTRHYGQYEVRNILDVLISSDINLQSLYQRKYQDIFRSKILVTEIILHRGSSVYDLIDIGKKVKYTYAGVDGQEVEEYGVIFEIEYDKHTKKIHLWGVE